MYENIVKLYMMCICFVGLLGHIFDMWKSIIELNDINKSI